MRKVALLVLCTVLILRGKEALLSPEEKWKPLDNPRNRDLFFRTLQAYFSGRDLDLRKFSDNFSGNNDRPRPVAIYSDPAASAFADYEGKKKLFKNYFKG
ncbi:uncharacterized protein C2orf66 homolog [Carettochelys insculpta]|uniref:uncharacterized protein C2orf66 homolog n=1 Tax=Carettochelys insculpta TaxID=44489 RepID=UPI003EB78C7A